MMKQLDTGVAYTSSAIFLTPHADILGIALVKTTGMQMAICYFTGSGSEAVESMIKATIIYHKKKDNNNLRYKIISRMPAYHGTTLGALGLTNMPGRKDPFVSLISPIYYYVSACNPYHDRLDGETDVMYVARKALELENKFQ